MALNLLTFCHDHTFFTKGVRTMTTSLCTATVGAALALILVGSTARAQESTAPGVCAVGVERGHTLGFTDSIPSWSSEGRQIQFAGKIICTECTLEEASQAYPNLSYARLYEVRYGDQRMVTELAWASNPHWREELIAPHVVQLRANENLLDQMLAKENRAKKLQVSGLLSHAGILYVSEVQVCN